MDEPIEKALNRRKFLTSVGLIGAAAGIGTVPVFAESAEVSTALLPIMKCSPYLQGMHSDKMYIRWLTNVPTYSWVEYGETPSMLDHKAHHVIEGMVQANNTMHDIAIKNLQPGKTYYYQVLSKKIEKFDGGKITYGDTATSKVYSFETLPTHKESVQFSVLNDIHDRPESFSHLYNYLQEGKSDFILLNGDMFNSLREGENQIVENLLNPLNNLFASTVPFVFTRGNHEARGEYSRLLPDYLNGMQNKFYYSFELGPMYVIVLDSGEDKEDEHPVYGGIISFDEYRLEQRAWLEEEMKKKAFRKAKYRVAFSHIPPYYTANKDAHGTAFCREHWVPVLNKANIDIMFSGHTHRHGVHPAVQGVHNFPIVIGGGPKDGQRTIINVKANPQQLALEVVDDSGKVVGRLTI